MERLLRVKRYFAKIRPRYSEFLSDINGVETEIFKSQIPGGMISNMESQLKQQGAGDRLQEVLEEVPRVRRDAGYPPLVTPSSQITGSQAVLNVLMGKYKVLTGEFADLMLGYYGSTLGEKNPEVLKLAAGTRQEAANHLPSGGFAEAGMGRRCVRRPWPWKVATAATRMCSPTRCSRRWRRSFLLPAIWDPKILGKDPVKAGPAPAPAAGAAPANASRNPQNYVVTLNGKEHRVTVAPAQ